MIRLNSLWLLAGLLLQTLFPIHSQPTWQRVYPHNFGASIGHDVQPTADGGFIFVGEIDFPTGAIRHYVRLIKVDGLGNVEWERIYKENEITYESGYSLRIAANGDFVIGGISNGQIYLMRIAPAGDTLFTRIHEGWGYNRCEVVRILPNGDFLLGGGYTGIDTDQPFILRTDSLGQVLWETLLEVAPLGGRGVSDLEIEDENHFITLSNNGSTQLTGINATGMPQWSANYLFSKYDMMESMALDGDEKYLLSGSGSGFAGFSPLLTRVDASGSQEWFNGSGALHHHISSVEKLPDGHIIAGIHDLYSSPPTGKVQMQKNASGGDLLWTRSFDGDASRFRVYPLADGRIIGCGTLNGQMMLLLTDANGEILPTSNEEAPVSDQVGVFPNPTTGIIHVTEGIQGERISRLAVWSAAGVELMQCHPTQATPIAVDLSLYPAGVYWIGWETNTKAGVARVIRLP